MKKILVTRSVSEMELKPLIERYDVEINQMDRNYSYEELSEKVKGKDAVLCMLSDKIDGKIMDSEPNVKIFANYAVGYNNFNVNDAIQRKVYLSNTPGVLTEATADLAWTLIMATSRKVIEGDDLTRNGRFKGWDPKMLLGKDVYSKTIGIIGAGRIGQAVGRRAKGFNMDILYTNRTRKLDFENEVGAKYVELDVLLRKSDYVSIHIPLNEETRYMIDKSAFKIMKSSSILINTARGAVVNEKDLVDALKNGEIWGAGLDVYENEPEIENELLKLKNTVLLPHLGSATEESRNSMVRIAVENIISVLEGNEPINSVY